LVRGDINIFSYYGYFSVLSYPAVILSGIYASRYGFIKLLSWVSFIPVLLFEFIFMSRANILWALFLYFSVSSIIYYLNGKKFFTKKNIFKYVLTFVILLLLINVVYFFRGGGEIQLYYKKYLRYEEPENIFLRILYSGYPYITAPLPALDILIERTDSPLLMGGKTFRPLIIFAESKYKSHYYPFVRVPIPANIYTYLGDVYMDFGLAGFVVIPFLFGVVSSIFYSKSFTTPTIFNLAMTSIIYSQLELSFLYSRFSFGNIWITIFIFVTLMKYFKPEK
jgi:oligosaccharide repeat unit polymerase